MPASSRFAVLAAALAALALLSCGGDDAVDPGPVPEVFTTGLAASAVVEDVVSSATGSASFTAGIDGSLAWTIDVNGITAVTMAHIHGPASAQQNADIVLTLFEPDNPTGTINGRLVSGSAAPGSELLTSGWTMAQVLNLVRTGQAYVLVHTTEYPDGEIRGNFPLP